MVSAPSIPQTEEARTGSNIRVFALHDSTIFFNAHNLVIVILGICRVLNILPSYTFEYNYLIVMYSSVKYFQNGIGNFLGAVNPNTDTPPYQRNVLYSKVIMLSN